jgi:HSP20 family molecular chaperone IbpA
VELPGVRKEDVHVQFMDGILRIKVSKDGRVHQKDVPCKVPPGSIEVKSTRENNSVVEITFIRKTRGDRK